MADQRNRFSLEGKLAGIVCGVAVVNVVLGAVFQAMTGHVWLTILFALTIGVPLGIWAISRFMSPVNRLFQALIGGVASLRDSDFSISITETRSDELGDLVAVYNGLGSTLRDERQELFQRELLLDTVIQSTPLALVLTNSKGAIVFSNRSARKLFLDGRRLEGRNFEVVLQNVPRPMSDAVASKRDGLFTLESDAEQETYHLSQREFILNTQVHQLYLFKRLTREISRREVATWKTVIRVIGHELNNSLAPISSLAHSGTVLLQQQDLTRLGDIFSTIEERAIHLKTFIDGYARFAKLPIPQPVDVAWAGFIETLKKTSPFTLRGDLPANPGYFDPVQIEQVLINLLKNAHESGSAESDVSVSTKQNTAQQTLRVMDRGSGMSDKVLNSALLPFYSTKQKGSGLGLPLCREIIEAHGGRLSLANRLHGGLLVEISIPAKSNAMTTKNLLAI